MASERQLDMMYMDIAERVSQMSVGKRAKVGALIVKDGNIRSFGWNGTPSGFDNCCEEEVHQVCPLESNLVTKPDVVHAEMNAFSKILKSGGASIDGATLYITMSPCFDCAKLIIQSGIKLVIFRDAYRKTESIKMLQEADVNVIRLATDGEYMGPYPTNEEKEV